MKCKHKFKTINTVSRRTYQKGSQKFRSGFEEANSHGIKILVARRQQCRDCGKKRTTVEISKKQLDAIFSNLSSRLEKEPSNMPISSVEKKVRDFLINVAKGQVATRHEKKAMYKEVWDLVYPSRQFGRGNTNEVVEWIVNISNYDTDNGKPPLNSLVVRGDTGMPGASWEEWKNQSGVLFENAEEAQQACWNYWNNK